jgi:hypothetical protein
MPYPVRPDRLTPCEESVVVAVMACERAEHGYPCRRAIEMVAAYGDESLPSRLAGGGWLESIRIEGDARNVVYRATARAWRHFGYEPPSEAEERKTA